MVESIIFWAFAVLSVGAALAAMLHHSIVYSALFLIVVFLSISGFFLLNNADFLAIAQLVLYAVGITIIMLFAIMFTGDRPPIGKPLPRPAKLGLILVVLYTGVMLLQAVTYPFVTTVPSERFIAILQERGTTELVGSLMFRNYALPLVLSAILLLVAMIGAIVISRKSFAGHDIGDVRFDVDPENRLTEEARRALEASQRVGQEEDACALAEQDAGESDSDENASDASDETVGAR